MERSFWLGTHIKNFLFEGYDLTSIWGLLATCVGASSLAILYEAGRIYKLHCKTRLFPEAEEMTDSITDTATLMTSCSETATSRSAVDRFYHAAKYTIFCMQNEFIGYILMLSVMRFNVAIALAVWFGAGLGYFVFAANISTSLSSRKNGQRSRRRSERSVTPHQDFDSTTEKLSEENAGDENQEGWKAEASQQPFHHGQNHSVTEPCDHLPDNEENQDGFATATVIVHREPSSTK